MFSFKNSALKYGFFVKCLKDFFFCIWMHLQPAKSLAKGKPKTDQFLNIWVF